MDIKLNSWRDHMIRMDKAHSVAVRALLGTPMAVVLTAINGHKDDYYSRARITDNIIQVNCRKRQISPLSFHIA